jgi:hypothetical protein
LGLDCKRLSRREGGTRRERKFFFAGSKKFTQERKRGKSKQRSDVFRFVREQSGNAKRRSFTAKSFFFVQILMPNWIVDGQSLMFQAENEVSDFANR